MLCHVLIVYQCPKEAHKTLNVLYKTFCVLSVEVFFMRNAVQKCNAGMQQLWIQLGRREHHSGEVSCERNQRGSGVATWGDSIT